MSKITTAMKNIWLVENTCAFEGGGSSYHFIFETGCGYLSTRGMLIDSVTRWLEELVDAVEFEISEDLIQSKPQALEHPELTPHLKVTEIRDIRKYLLCLKLSK
jgi:hypothetical protein